MILTKNLECSACGGRQITRTGQNEYRCQHCSALTLVEDDVAQRLEKILVGLQQRPAAAPAVDPKQARIAVAGAVAAVVAIAGLAVLGSLFDRGKAPTRTAAAAAPRSVDPAKLKIDSVRETTLGTSRHLVGRLVNDTGQVIRAPSVKVGFYNGENRGQELGAATPAQWLLPGEYAFFDLPLPATPFSRYEITKGDITTPYETVQRARVVANRLQLVRQESQLSLVGGLRNEGSAPAGSVAVVATLYDREHRIVGQAHGYPQANKLAPSEATLFRATCKLVDDSEVASFDYLVESEQKTPVVGKQTTIVSVDKPAFRSVDGDANLTLEELLDPAFAFFDPKWLALSPPRPVLSDTQQRLFIAEVSNRSADRVAVEPSFTIAFFDGSREVARETKKPGRFLYPGEKWPVMFGNKSGFSRFSEYKITWADFKQSALPGPAVRIEATVDKHSAEFGSLLVNFSARYRYKYVSIGGRLANQDTVPVDRVDVTVVLYDAQNQITGFGSTTVSAKLAPGETIPFALDVTQNGADFRSYRVHVQAQRRGGGS